MFDTLERILTDHPMLKFMMGIDANHFIKDESYPDTVNFKRVPENNEIPTTLKKRTFLQCQFDKSNIEVSEVKDMIITNRTVQKYLVENVEGKPIEK